MITPPSLEMSLLSSRKDRGSAKKKRKDGFGESSPADPQTPHEKIEKIIATTLQAPPLPDSTTPEPQTLLTKSAKIAASMIQRPKYVSWGSSRSEARNLIQVAVRIEEAEEAAEMDWLK